MKMIHVLLFGLHLFGTAQAGDIPEKVKASIRDRVAKEVNTGIVLALIDADGVVYFSEGRVHVDGGAAVSEHTIFEIGSISKTFTALLLAEMAIRGEVGLEDPIQKFLPDGFRAPTRKDRQITLIHLATHRSSLPGMPPGFRPANPEDPFADYEAEKIYAFLNTYQLPRDIGSQRRYSNLGMGLLGNLLARAANTDFDKLLGHRILAPLGMDRTGVRLQGKHPEQVATGHSNGAPVSPWDFNSFVPAGGIQSNAVDMARYISAQMHGREDVLSRAMQRTQVIEEGRKMGLGWLFQGPDIIFHGGETNGFRAFAGFRRDGSRGVVVLSNSLGRLDDLGFHLLNPELPLQPVVQSLERAIGRVIDQGGIAAAIAEYVRLKENHRDQFDFNPSALNDLGYQLLSRKRYQEAIAIFELNVSEYPDEGNPYDSLGEAYLEAGNQKAAIAAYKKALARNPGNQNAVKVLESLGEKQARKAVHLPAKTLSQYPGRYQLAANFILTVSLEGSQLMVRPTGQSNSPIFASAVDQFYFSSINARITFNRNEKGQVESLTLHQNGNHVARRLVE